jgi:hypothetical protein
MKGQERGERKARGEKEVLNRKKKKKEKRKKPGN